MVLGRGRLGGEPPAEDGEGHRPVHRAGAEVVQPEALGYGGGDGGLTRTHGPVDRYDGHAYSSPRRTARSASKPG